MNVNSVSSWEKFNKAVTEAKARTSTTTINGVRNRDNSSVKKTTSAPLSQKLYGSRPNIESKNRLLGSRFDSYA